MPSVEPTKRAPSAIVGVPSGPAPASALHSGVSRSTLSAPRRSNSVPCTSRIRPPTPAISPTLVERDHRVPERARPVLGGRARAHLRAAGARRGGGCRSAWPPIVPQRRGDRPVSDVPPTVGSFPSPTSRRHRMDVQIGIGLLALAVGVAVGAAVAAWKRPERGRSAAVGRGRVRPHGGPARAAGRRAPADRRRVGRSRPHVRTAPEGLEGARRALERARAREQERRAPMPSTAR